MIASATLQNDAFFFADLGVDGLADIDMAIGGSTVCVLDFADIGINTGLGLGGTMTGQGSAVEDVAQTGIAGDGAALLVGAAGIDTLSDTDVTVVVTGFNTVLALETAPVSGISCDISVSLILHRIAMFSAAAPASVAVRTGYAR